ncbi:MAG: GtrA family protein [Arcobacter butzleri]|nr:GtrA family protein [Aliarcobacter butzleri]
MNIIKYFFVGAMAAIVDIGVFVLLAKVLGYNYILVAIISFVLGTLVNYLLSIKYVFSSGTRYTKSKEIGLVYSISAIGLLLNVVIIYISYSVLGVELVSSKLISTAIVFFWNYLARKYFVF